MPNIGTNAEIDGVRLKEQASAPSTPDSGYGQLYCNASGLYFKDDAGTARPVSVGFATDDITDPPTDAELDTAFGTPATVGLFLGFVDDNNADTNVFLCFSNGTSWYYAAKLTKAT